MRINYYRFPKDMSYEERFNAYFKLLADEGDDPEYIERRKRWILNDVAELPDELEAISVTTAKKMLKLYGGYAYTQHFERDGGLFETSEIKLKGNNSKFKYNKHL